MANTPSAKQNVSSLDFESIADNFTAPDEISLPYQQHLTRIRQAFAALDGRVLGIKQVFNSLILDPTEQALADNFYESIINLHTVILNRAISAEAPNQAPAKDSRITY